MITGKEDLLGALAEAYAMEKGSREFYGFAASKAGRMEAGETFQRLQSWEDTHMEYIAHLHRAFQGDLDIESYEAFEKHVPATHTEAGISLPEAMASFVPENYPGDREAIDLALQMEGKAYALYKKMADAAVDGNARVVFTEMMGQEQRHVEVLQRVRTVMSSTP